MFEYNICTVFNEDIFKKQCVALEENIPNLCKKDFLQDVDGSDTQIYELDGKRIRVVNDSAFGVEIQSEFDIKPYFNKSK